MLDLWHFVAEQLNHEFWRIAREDDGRAAKRWIHFHDHGSHAVASTQVFLGNHVAATQTAFDAAALYDQAFFVGAFDGAHKNLVASAHEIIEQNLALSIADFLQNHLLRSLRANTTDWHRIHLLFDVVARLHVCHAIQRIHQHLFCIGILQTLVIGHDQPAAKGFVVTRVAIHRDADLHITMPFVLINLLAGLRKSRFQRTKYGLAINVFLTGNGFNKHQHFAVHGHSPYDSVLKQNKSGQRVRA